MQVLRIKNKFNSVVGILKKHTCTWHNIKTLELDLFNHGNIDSVWRTIRKLMSVWIYEVKRLKALKEIHAYENLWRSLCRCSSSHNYGLQIRWEVRGVPVPIRVTALVNVMIAWWLQIFPSRSLHTIVHACIINKS